MKSNLTPRAMGALATAALSAFLLLCFASYSQADASSVRGPVGLADTLASWFVGPLGAGAHVIAVLGLAWGVIVYFQERTPDLVLRVVGTTTLAASTAMLMGLVNGGKASVWAGTVGEAGARMMIGMGTAGTVLGWTVALALCGASMIFATDSLFNTLRRSGRPAYDPSLMPVEPSRGDLLEGETEAEPRVFVRSESRAAVAVEHLATAEPRPLEVRPESLPQGFSAAETAIGTVVRGPQGYEGVEFLAPSDELALPEARAVVPSFERRFDGLMDEDVNFDATHFDPVVGSDTDDEHETSARARFGDDEAPTQDTPQAGSSSPAAAPQYPVFVAGVPAEPVAQVEHGIALADASLLVDEVFSFPTSDFESSAGVPNDGASAAAEIASTYTRPEPAAEPEEPAAAPAVAHVEPAEDEPASDEFLTPSFLEEEIVLGGGPVFGDDEIYVYDSGSGYEQPASSPDLVSAAFEPAGAVALAERAESDVVPGIALPQAAAGESHLEVFEQSFASPAQVSPDPLTISQAIVIAVGDLATDAAAEAPLFVAVSDAPVAEPAADAPSVPEAIAASVSTAAAEADPMSVSQAIVIAVGDVPVVAAVETSPETSAPVDAAPAAEAPVAAVEPVAAPAPAEVAVAPETHAAEAPVVAQLALFPAATCDLSKLRTMELDPLFLDAAEAILVRGRASSVVLQRALGISYARGLRILDQMTEAAMLGPDSPGGSREICFTRDAWTAFLGRA